MKNTLASIFCLFMSLESLAASHFYLPWSNHGMDSETKVSFKKNQNAIDDKWLSTMFESAKKLSKEDNFKTLSSNMQKSLEQVYLGEKTISKDESFIFEPIMCLYEKKVLLGLSVIHAKSAQLEHFVYSMQDRKASLLGTAEQLMDQIQKEMGQKRENKTGFKIAITSPMAFSFGEKTSSYCLELILSKKLLEHGITVLNTIQNEKISTLHNWKTFTKQPSFYEPAKATRHMSILWSLNKQAPNQVGVKMRFSEAIFASHPAVNFDVMIPYSLNPTEKRFDFELPKELQDFLIGEKNSLSFSEVPKSVLIKKAGVYLDKGRSWGLQLSDRLVEKNDPKAIKGHIVGFFGSELALKDKKGRLIHDGAIMFVRKGQRITKRDQNFVYEDKSYPTPWPP